MNKTTHAHRLYVVVGIVAATMMLVAGPAAGGIDGPPRPPGDDRVDAWAAGRASATDDDTQHIPQVDAWAVNRVQPAAPVDAWVTGQLDRAQVSRSVSAGSDDSPATTPIPLHMLALGLVFAAALGGATALAVNHRRGAPSAR